MKARPFRIESSRGTVQCLAAPMDWSLVVAERGRPPVHRLLRPGGPEERALFSVVGRLRRYWAKAMVRGKPPLP